MEFDIVLASLPVFTQKCPSLGLASLATYLKSKKFKVSCYDFSPQFHAQINKRFKITSSLIQELNLSLDPLWGAANWLGLNEAITPQIGHHILTSLCPVCSELYRPIFNEFQSQISLTQKVLDSYIKELVNLDTRSYGFSLLLGNAAASLYVIKKIKERKPDVPIIVGGPETSPYYRAPFYSETKDIDIIIYHSEGEIPLEYFLLYLKGNLAKQNIPGICFKTQNGLEKTPPPSLLDLNDLPIPDFELVQTGSKLHQLKSLDILISKGCPHQCTFCNEPLLWGSYRPKKVNKIADEIHYYVETHGIDHFELGDNTFSASPTFIPALEKLYSAGIKVNWSGNCKINELNTQKIQDYQKFGLIHSYFGIESGSPKILRLMGKNFDISSAAKLLKSCHKHQIKTSLYFMVGFPGETSVNFQETVDFINQNHYITNFMTSVFSLMPGTPILNSNLLTPIQIGPKALNTFTYQTQDGVTHEERKNRFMSLQKLKQQILSVTN
jgi:radical SAM superfamily enzyme YgiQ (UPF0313 family)